MQRQLLDAAVVAGIPYDPQNLRIRADGWSAQTGVPKPSRQPRSRA